MKRSKILIIGPDKDVKGGVSTVINSYLHSVLAIKYDLILLASYIDGSKFSKLVQFLKSIFHFFWIILFKNIRIIHIHSASRASFFRKSIFLLISKIFRRKVMFHIHGAEFNIFYHQECGVIKKIYVRRILLLADFIIVLSKQWKKDIDRIGGKASKTHIIFNAVKILPLLERKKKSNVNILFMGRLEQRKGIFDLLKTAENLIQKHINIKFILCGDGCVEDLRQRVLEKFPEEFFDIPGWITNKAKVYQQADIYVLPSYNEGLPMSILEACNYGLPIVSTPVGGIPEIIEDGTNGFLVKPGDVKALEERLLRLIESPELRKKMGRKGYEKVKDKFNIDHIVDQISKLYEELLCQ